MPIIVNVDVMLARRKMKLNALAEAPEPPASAPRDPDALIALRIRLGLTRSVMAKRMGVTPELLRAWEEGQGQPSEGELSRLALFGFPGALERSRNIVIGRRGQSRVRHGRLLIAGHRHRSSFRH